jgi:hypothetical protein
MLANFIDYQFCGHPKEAINLVTYDYNNKSFKHLIDDGNLDFDDYKGFIIDIPHRALGSDVNIVLNTSLDLINSLYDNEGHYIISEDKEVSDADYSRESYIIDHIVDRIDKCRLIEEEGLCKEDLINYKLIEVRSEATQVLSRLNYIRVELSQLINQLEEILNY